MKFIKPMIPYLRVTVLGFYLPPALIRDTVSGMVILLVIMPAVCLTCAVLFGCKHKISLSYPLLVSVLFLPAVFIFFNLSALIYAAVYAVIALAGNLIGSLISGGKS